MAYKAESMFNSGKLFARVFLIEKNDQDFLETIKACSGNEFCF